MGKRAFVILMTLMLGLAGVLGPAYCAAAQDKDDNEKKEQDAGILEDLYEKVDEAVSGVDKDSLRREIRKALREMDKMGISPSGIARDLFGIGAAVPGSDGKKPGNTMFEDVEKTIRKSTEKFFSTIWNGFLNTLGGVLDTGFSMLGEKGGK